MLAFRLLDLWLPLLVGAAAGARQYRRNRAAAAAAVVLEPPLLVGVLPQPAVAVTS